MSWGWELSLILEAVVLHLWHERGIFLRGLRAPEACWWALCNTRTRDAPLSHAEQPSFGVAGKHGYKALCSSLFMVLLLSSGACGCSPRQNSKERRRERGREREREREREQLPVLGSLVQSTRWRRLCSCMVGRNRCVAGVNFWPG